MPPHPNSKRRKGRKARAGPILQRAMNDAWRTVLRDAVRTAREGAQAEAKRDLDSLLNTLRSKAVADRHCGICDQDVVGPSLQKLSASIPGGSESSATPPGGITNAMSRLADLNKFRDADNAGEIRQLWRQAEAAKLRQVSLKDRLADLKSALADSNQDSIRRSKASYGEVVEKQAAVRKAIEEETKKAEEKDQNIQRIKKKLEAFGDSDLRVGQRRAKMLHDAAEVFGAAVERYKAELRARVEATGTKLFLSMTTERRDYAGLAINESYGLNIKHKDGRTEEARSAGAEHVVALALMGALQRNAPLRGPIVMDSPFGRLDEEHTDNVIKALPDMAEQVVLLVYEAEVGKAQMRKLLGPHLLREYQLDRVSARRTNVREVK